MQGTRRRRLTFARMTRTLTLRRERLTDLSPSDLAAVAGGQTQQPTYGCPDYTYYCITGPKLCPFLSEDVCK